MVHFEVVYEQIFLWQLYLQFLKVMKQLFSFQELFCDLPCSSLSSEDEMSSVGTVVSRLMSSDSMELEMFAVASFGFLGGISTQRQSNRPTD